MVTVGFIGDNKPKVSYATAMDVYIILCFAFVFCALVEFAFIHFVEMFVRRVRFKDQERAVHLQEMTKSMIAPLMENCTILTRAFTEGLPEPLSPVNIEEDAQDDFQEPPVNVVVNKLDEQIFNEKQDIIIDDHEQQHYCPVHSTQYLLQKQHHLKIFL